MDLDLFQQPVIKIGSVNWRSAEELARLEARAYCSKYSIHLRLEWAFACEHGYVYVARNGDAIVGALSALPTKQGDIYLHDLVVDPEHQGQGIGSILLKTLLKEADTKSIKVILHTQKPVTQFYAKHGFTVTDKIKGRFFDQVTHYAMERPAAKQPKKLKAGHIITVDEAEFEIITTKGPSQWPNDCILATERFGEYLIRVRSVES